MTSRRQHPCSIQVVDRLDQHRSWATAMTMEPPSYLASRGASGQRDGRRRCAGRIDSRSRAPAGAAQHVSTHD